MIFCSILLVLLWKQNYLFYTAHERTYRQRRMISSKKDNNISWIRKGPMTCKLYFIAFHFPIQKNQYNLNSTPHHIYLHFADWLRNKFNVLHTMSTDSIISLTNLLWEQKHYKILPIHAHNSFKTLLLPQYWTWGDL